jgi:hypothetical protein
MFFLASTTTEPTTTTDVSTTETPIEETTRDPREDYVDIVDSLTTMMRLLQLSILPSKTKDPVCYASCSARASKYMTALMELQLNLLVWSLDEDVEVMTIMYTNIMTLKSDWNVCKTATKPSSTTAKPLTTTKIYPTVTASDQCVWCKDVNALTLSEVVSATASASCTCPSGFTLSTSFKDSILLQTVQCCL